MTRGYSASRYHAIPTACTCRGSVMSSPDLGVSLSANGLSVALNPNGIEMRVTRGPKGAILTVASCGITFRCALPEEARPHLVHLLSNPPSGASPDRKRPRLNPSHQCAHR